MCRCSPISPSCSWRASICRPRWSAASRTSPGCWDRAMILPRANVTEDDWGQAIDRLAGGSQSLLGLWGDTGAVHMALFDEKTSDIAVLTYACKDSRYPSVGAKHPPAIRLERAIRDLFGLEATDAPDTRPWLDLGFWDVRHPLGKKGPAQKLAP